MFGKVRRNCMKKIKCIALDLDGTTLRNNGTLSERNRKAIDEAIRRGIHVIVASGRPFSSLPKEILEIDGISFAITSNGANGYEVKTGKRIFSHIIKEELVDQLLQYLERNRGIIEIFVNGIPYAPREYVECPWKFGTPEHAYAYIQKTRVPVDDIYACARKWKKQMDSIDIMVQDLEQKEKFREAVEAIEGIYITSSVPRLLEISDIHAGKAEGLKYFSRMLGLKPDEIAAFGNAENDLDMMQYAGYGIAVSNTPEEIKNQVQYQTLSNDEDGVAVWLEQYFAKI